MTLFPELQYAKVEEVIYINYERRSKQITVMPRANFIWQFEPKGLRLDKLISCRVKMPPFG